MVSANSIPVLSTSIATLTAAYAMCLVAFQSDILPSWVNTLLLIVSIPVIGYFLSLLGSSMYQFGKCKKVDFKGIALSNMALLGTVGFGSFVLWFESVPVLKYIFGAYAPRNPLTGDEYPQESTEYIESMENEKHYKIQFFSNIVKAVLPMYLTEPVKDGMAYAYWIFFLTLLPSYFLMSLSSAC
jgi:hypothetical protein